MENELISVVVPVYNVGKYVEQCLNSIINQTYKNLEIILVDDGSTDNSGKICDEFAKKDDRIKVIHKKNGGLSDARNEGMKVVNGEFIAFVDSDDFLDVDFYEYLMKLQNKYNSDITECNFINVYEDKLNEFKFPKKPEENVIVTDGIGAVFLLMSDDDGISTNSVVVWNKLYRKSLFDEISFPVGKTHEDQFTTYKLLFKANIFVTSTQIKYGYFQRTDSIVNKKFNKKRFDTFLAFDEFLSYCEKCGYDEFKEKILRRYLKTGINFIKLLNSVDGSEKLELKEKLENLINNKYNYIKDYIENNPLHHDKIDMYDELIKEFNYKINNY